MTASIIWSDAEGPFGCTRYLSDCGCYQVLEGPEGVAWAFQGGWRNGAKSLAEAKASANSHRAALNERLTFNLTWNMSDDGVVSLYAKDVNGRAVDLADIYRRPLRQALGVSEERARELQIEAAERIVDLWNKTTVSTSTPHYDRTHE